MEWNGRGECDIVPSSWPLYWYSRRRSLPHVAVCLLVVTAWLHGLPFRQVCYSAAHHPPLWTSSMMARLCCWAGMVTANCDLWNLLATTSTLSLTAAVAWLLLFPNALLTGGLDLHLR